MHHINWIKEKEICASQIHSYLKYAHGQKHMIKFNNSSRLKRKKTSHYTRNSGESPKSDKGYK